MFLIPHRKVKGCSQGLGLQKWTIELFQLCRLTNCDIDYKTRQKQHTIYHNARQPHSLISFCYLFLKKSSICCRHYKFWWLVYCWFAQRKIIIFKNCDVEKLKNWMNILRLKTDVESFLFHGIKLFLKAPATFMLHTLNYTHIHTTYMSIKLNTLFGNPTYIRIEDLLSSLNFLLKTFTLEKLSKDLSGVWKIFCRKFNFSLLQNFPKVYSKLSEGLF